MKDIKKVAHQAGVVYFVFMIIAIIDNFMLPSFVVQGDAAATAQNIAVMEFTYRISLLGSFATQIIFIFLVAILYKLFKDVDKHQARLMVLLVITCVAFSIANLVNKLAPLVILKGSDYLSAFTKPQLDAMTLGFLKLKGTMTGLAITFWGLWLFPFGILVIKSRFFPKVLGILLYIAGIGYVINSVTRILWPEYSGTVAQVLMPLYFGELPIIFWLLIKGAKEPHPEQA